MRPTVIRDPGGDRLVRIVTSNTITDGSILIVPSDSVAFFVVNGVVSEPFTEGRYSVDTGVSPFFVRFRNLMTNGDPGITVSVFFVATRLEAHMTLGSGEVLFAENRYKLTMGALAAYSIDYRIINPESFVKKLVGMHSSAFHTEDLDPKIRDILSGPVSEEMSRRFSLTRVSALNDNLSAMSCAVRTAVNSRFVGYGIEITALSINHINIGDRYLAQYRELEQFEAKEKLKTDTEQYNIDRIYGGNVGNRTFAEVLTGTARGNYEKSDRAGGISDLSTLAMQLAMLRRMPDSMWEGFDNMVNGFNPAPRRSENTPTEPPHSTEGSETGHSGLPPIKKPGEN